MVLKFTSFRHGIPWRNSQINFRVVVIEIVYSGCAPQHQTGESGVWARITKVGALQVNSNTALCPSEILRMRGKVHGIGCVQLEIEKGINYYYLSYTSSDDW